MNNVEEIKKIIQNAKNIVVITGAGISTPSGIPDIRSKNGAMNNKDLIKRYKYKYETIVSHSFFFEHTEDFYKYYKEQMIHGQAKPNEAHLFLKELENNHHVTIITQNIDGLHSLAGSIDVVEFHGSVNRNTCLNCGEKYSLRDIIAMPGVPHCPHCGGIIKPDVVLFEEGIDYESITRSLNAMEHADLLLVIGSSLMVYPAADLISYFHGNNSVLINRDITNCDSFFKIVVHDDIIKVIKELEK